MIQPIHDLPILRVDNAAVIGDLHIGVETHLGIKGFHIPSKTNTMRKEITELPDDITRLIVIGDVKDSVPGSSKQEYREIPDFFQTMLDRFDIVDVISGNHDTNIDEFLPTHVHVHPATGMKIGRVGFIHGHTWPSAEVMDSDILVMAHNHPTVMFEDGIGKRTTEPCWIKGKFTGRSQRYLALPETFIVVPAFNRLLGGSPVNVEGEGFLGPILNDECVDLDNSKIYLLDGIDLGKRCDLMVTENRKHKK